MHTDVHYKYDGVMTSRAPRRDAVENRLGILAAARSALALDPHASIDTIARSAGLSRRTLYGHFGDREALIRELIAHGAQRFNAIAASVADPDARIALARLAARLWLETAHVQVTAALALDEAHVSHTGDALAPLRRTVADLTRRGQDEGSFRTDIDAPTLASLIEQMARVVVSQTDASDPGASSVAVRAVLSIAGLSWREADDLLAAHPEILAPELAPVSPSARAIEVVA